MKNWTSRFVVLMVAGAIMCSALMVGCGGGNSDGTATSGSAPAVNNMPSKGNAAPPVAAGTS